MSDIIPQDDDITKTQLWQRIDVTRAAFESHKGEVLLRLQTVVEDLKSQLSTISSEQTVLVHNRLNDVEGWLTAYKLEQNRSLTETIKNIQSLFQSHLADVETSLKGLRDSIEDTVKKDSSDLFSANEQRLTTVESRFEDLSKGLNESLGRYQVETRTKVGDLKSRIEKVISKLRDGFQDL
jgi:hypothetical protein